MSENKKIGEVFDGRIFRIPDYQRGYAWETSNLQAFWDDLDLLRSTPGGAPHYTGVISLEKISKGASEGRLSRDERWLLDEYDLYLVVDGQQRLTTIIIFLHELLRHHQSINPKNDVLTSTAKRSFIEERFIRQPNLMVEGNFGYRFGYLDNTGMNDFFRGKILEDKNVHAPGEAKSAYAHRLMNARDFFRKKLNVLDNTVLISELYKIAADRLRFNIFEVSSEFDVCMTFEAMNNRGKDLSDLEKLKSRVLYLSGLLAATEYRASLTDQKLEGYKKHINACWTKVYNLLGWSADRVLDDDQFLNLAWTLRYGKIGESRDSHLFQELFTPKRVTQSDCWTRIQEFSSDLATIIPSWVLVNHPDASVELLRSGNLSVGIGEEAGLWLVRLNRLNGTAAFNPLITAALVHHQAGNVCEKELVGLLRAIERYVFVIFGLADRRSHTGRSAYLSEASKLYLDPSNVGRITDRVQEEVTWRCSMDTFVDVIQLRQTHGEGFYSWSELRVVLYEYEEHLHKTRHSRDDPKIVWNELTVGRLGETIEHIYPQTADDVYWVNRFGCLDPSVQHVFLHMLGNLLLLSHRKNSSLQNASFIQKATEGDERYSVGSYSEMSVAEGAAGEWTPDAILKRTESLLVFIGTRWNVPHWDEACKRILAQVKALIAPPKAGLDAAE
jgi:hypothetical protein